MITITNTNQLLIQRNGNIDWQYTDQQIKAERTEALQRAGHELVRNVATRSLNVAQRVGMCVLEALDEAVLASR